MSLNLSETIKNLSEAKAKYDELVDAAIDPLKRQLVNIINENEDVVAFGWTQYTPYFNDGDACVFGIGELFYVPASLIGEEDGQYANLEDAFADHWELPNVWESWDGTIKEGPESLRELVKFMSSNEEVFERAFGDHAVVKVTAAGVEVEGYDHD